MTQKTMVGFTEMEVFVQDLEQEGDTRWGHSLSRG